MEITNKYHKTDTIGSWKRAGVIYHNFDELYEIYIKTMNCMCCKKEFPNTVNRCLDHDHETGAFRKIVCRGCNNYDTYIKYPNGYTKEDRKTNLKKNYQNNKQTRLQKQKQYSIDNKDKVKEQKKKYYEANKEKILQRAKIKYQQKKDLI